MWLKSFYHLIEAFFVFALYGFFRLLPLDAASWLGGWIGRTFGPLTGVHQTAIDNLSRAMPELSAEERKKILNGMWDNLGRAAGEYPHLGHPVMRTRLTIHGAEHVESAKSNDSATVFISGHFANLEVAPLAIYMLGLPLVLLYRPANNPYVDWAIRKVRANFNVGMYPKGREAARSIVQAIKEKYAVGMLVDQKTNNGIAAPFFGRDAMTASASAEFSLKYKIPVLPVRGVRTKGAHFDVTIFPPVAFTDTGNYKQDVLAATTEINRMLEGWIREYPAQWFWVHNRWPRGS